MTAIHIINRTGEYYCGNNDQNNRDDDINLNKLEVNDNISLQIFNINKAEEYCDQNYQDNDS